ncbi:hypothetical protein ACEWPL_008680 [Roseovarius sp. S1116L3]
MSNAIKSLMALGLVVAVSACQQAPEDDYVVVEPVTTEPVQTGKY